MTQPRSRATARGRWTAAAPASGPREFGSRDGTGDDGATVSVITEEPELLSLREDWIALLQKAGSANPFLVPEWQLAWIRHFVRPGELQVVTVRHGGELVALAPFYRRRSNLGPAHLVTRLRLVGAGAGDMLTELPQIVTHPAWHRIAMKAIVHHVLERPQHADWVELSLVPQQGWLEPEWLPQAESPAPRRVAVQAGASATVVMALPSTDEALQAQLRPSLKRSIRRSHNRLERDDVAWRIETLSEPGPRLDRALSQLVTLHKARASLRGRLRHGDSFANPRQAEFLKECAAAMARTGQMRLLNLLVGADTAASVLVLRAQGTAFLSVTGMDPRWWDYGLVTLLHRECLRDAIESGDTQVNFLRGPNYAKLRWAEDLEVHHNFHLVAGRRKSHALYSLYAAYRSVSEFRVRTGRRVLDASIDHGPASAVRRILQRERDPGSNPY
jgi:CelD/BcsL family acetyltransferase involved in cellulose biosynthesis